MVPGEELLATGVEHLEEGVVDLEGEVEEAELLILAEVPVLLASWVLEVILLVGERGQKEEPQEEGGVVLTIFQEILDLREISGPKLMVDFVK